MTAADLVGGDRRDPPTKDSIQKCERKRMGAASSQTFAGGTPQLERDE